VNTTPRSCVLSAGVLALAAAACGAAAGPSTELLTARNVYAQASTGEAAQLNPTGVHEAYEALHAAEAVHEEDAGSQRERHYAYIALRKAELAISAASESLAKKEQQRADETYKTELEQQSQHASQQNSQFAQQLTQTQQQLQQHAQTLQQRQQELQEARVAADRAEAELRQAEAIREEEGRLVISLSGVLFEAGGDTLSKLAERRLDTVAHALGAYPDRPIIVEGYTDAQGSEATNQQLSQRRADSVREYLERRGVSSQQLRAVGKGEANPVASNETAEGRANNRRVEIIVDRETGPASSRDAAPRSRQGAVDSSRPSSAPSSTGPSVMPPAASDSFPAPRTPPAEEPGPQQ
jgi:outer membrane protein OmpA-like peptidoglycan-associated protein